MHKSRRDHFLSSSNTSSSINEQRVLKALEAFVVDEMNDANQKLLYKLKVNETK